MTGSPYAPFVDCSAWNAPLVTPEALKQANVEAVGVRIGRGRPDASTDLEGFDTTAEATVGALRRVRLPWWYYWRVGMMQEWSARGQALWVVKALSELPITPAPLMIDVEADREPLKGAALSRWLVDFRHELARMGVTNVSVYTNAWWWDGVAGLPLLWGDLDLVVSHWLRDSTTNDRLQMPVNARTWDEAAEEHLPAGPNMPNAWGLWSGWQLAGEGSGIGVQLGFSSTDIDCGLLRRDVFEWWFG